MSHLAPSTQIIFPSETRNEHTLAARAYVAGAPGLTKKRVPRNRATRFLFINNSSTTHGRNSD